MTDENLSGVAPAEDAALLPETPEAVEQVEGEIDSESSTEQTEDPQRKPKGLQRRFNEIVAQREEERRRAERAERMLEQALITRQPEQKPEPAAQPQPQGEPKLEQFQTYEDYVSALADFKADQKIAAWESRQREAEANRQKQTQATSFQQKVQAFSQENPDFNEVVTNPALRISQEVADLIVESDDPALAYLLAKNPQEAARISALPIRQAALELGRFAAKASMPRPKTVTGAPPPVEPISGGSGTMTVDMDKLSIAEWKVVREQQLKR
jgi:hypothetical protein